ncbi:MAG: hypothetical protein GX053_09275 [Tissierella sp.]|nr:hypothetical protein [Tissierella sp.]
MKKMISLILVICLLLSGVQVFAVNDTSDYLISNVINTEAYSKEKIINLKTGEEEILESFVNEDGTLSFIATSNKNVFHIEEENDNIVISEGAEVIQVIPVVKEKLETNELQLNNEIMPLAWGAWSSPLVTYHDIAFEFGISVGAMAGAIATYLTKSLTIGKQMAVSFGTSVASGLVAAGLFNVYIKRSTRTRVDLANQLYAFERTESFYKYSNYSGFIDSKSDYWEGDAVN